MFRWRAIVDIVKSFNEHGRPGLGFAAFFASLIVPGIVIVAVVALGGALK